MGKHAIQDVLFALPMSSSNYMTIGGFVPEYDADGNQTLIKTETGVWSVVYNAENRPVRWESGDTVITMAFDRMGRRVEYHETRAGQVATHFRFVYDNFLCVQRLNVANGNAVRTEFVWDLTEPIATRPLVFQPASGETAYYFHDGNKNVSEVFYHALQDGIAAHYDYAPFGAVTRTARATRVTNRDLLSENPFRFSSEYYDPTLTLIYYNYRHYIANEARWVVRDPQEEMERFGAYNFCNNTNVEFDYLGRIVPIVVSPITPINPPIVIDESGNVMPQSLQSPSSDDTLECIHIILDVAGALEPTPICDAVNALIYQWEGKLSEMGISICGMLPYLGDIGKGGKYICKSVKKTPNHVANHYFDYIVKKIWHECSPKTTI